MNFRIRMKGSEIMSFQENLRYYREKAGYKQSKDFAKVLGIPYPTYVGYESQGREPKYKILCQIADLLQVSTDDLLGRTINILGNKEDNILLKKINYLLDIANKKRYVNMQISNIDNDNIYFNNTSSSIDFIFSVDKQFLIKSFNNIEKHNNEQTAYDLIVFLSNTEKEQIICKLKENLKKASLIKNEKERTEKINQIIEAINLMNFFNINSNGHNKNIFEMFLNK